ncbi:hypothetical protein G5714_022985 [Onychostoma macrolepis]|uniref:Uncharacterized protein n=1 Tax=Onychostoma macrolepis TaxID=369639 RepID=A0A7J6BQ35_9TELE|nr:hypothetical protein G5714_022985 [Onychostoma macrolepis]
MPFRFTSVLLRFALETASKIPEQINQSEDGPFSMFTFQSHMTISAHSYPFTADKLKAKSSTGVFLSMDLSIFGHNLGCD